MDSPEPELASSTVRFLSNSAGAPEEAWRPQERGGPVEAFDPDSAPDPEFSAWGSQHDWLPPGRPVPSGPPRRSGSVSADPGGPAESERLLRDVLGPTSLMGETSPGDSDGEDQQDAGTSRTQWRVVDAWLKSGKRESRVESYIRKAVSMISQRKGQSLARSAGGLSTFRLRKHQSTSDGRQVYRVGSMVMIARPDDSLSLAASRSRDEPDKPRSLGCFRRQLLGNAGVNCVHMSPSGDMIITAGSTRTYENRPALSPQEAGWVQVWEEARDSPGWVLLGTMDNGGAKMQLQPEHADVDAIPAEGPGGGDRYPGVADSIQREWDDLIGGKMPPVTAITSHTRLMISATGHGNLAAGSLSGPCLVITWDLKQHVAKFLMTGHTGEVTAVSYHHEKPWLISASKDATVRLWNFNNGRQIYCIEAHSGPVNCLAAHMHMRSYCFAEQSGRVSKSRQNPAGQSMQGALCAENLMGVSATSWNSSEESGIAKSFATHRRMLLKKMAALERGREGGPAPDYSSQDVEMHEAFMGEFSGQPNNIFVTGGADCLVKIFDMSDGASVKSLKGHDREVTSVSIFKDRNPEQDRLASGSTDKTIRIWHLCTGACIRIIRTDRLITSVDFNKQEGILASASTNGVLQLWDVESGTCLAKYQSLQSNASTWLKEVTFMPKSNWLASLDVEGVISIWEWRTSPDSILRLDASAPSALRGTSQSRFLDTAAGSSQRMAGSTNIVVSPSRTYAAVSDKHFQVRIWELATQRLLAVLGNAHTSRNFMMRFFTSGLSFNPLETLLAMAGADNIVRVYNVSDGSLAHTLEHHVARVCCAEFSPGGAVLATAGFDRTVVLWDTKAWSVSRVLEDHLEWVTALAFSPDGRWLASGSWDDRLVINSMQSDACEPKALDCYSNVWSVSWQPLLSASDLARCVAAGTGAGMIHFFALDDDSQAWKEAGSLIAHEDVISSVCWSPSGSFLMSGSLDYSVRLWGPPKERHPSVKTKGPKQKLVVPVCSYGLFAKFACAVMSLHWTAKPESPADHEGDEGSMLAISTTAGGDYVLDASDIGQPAATYARTKFVYDKGGHEALIELAREAPLSLMAFGPSGSTILHDVLHDVELLGELLFIANQNGFSSAMPYGPQPLLMTAYAIPSEPAVATLVDSMVSNYSISATNFGSDIGTAAIFMLATGFPEQAARLLSLAGLKPANKIVYQEKWREFNPRVRMKPGTLHTHGSSTQFPKSIWGPDNFKRDQGTKEIEVIAACTSFQYAAGIPPGRVQFDKGFTPQEEDLHGNSGLERSLLHMAYNNDAMEILDTPVGRAILHYKWETYGRRAYLRSMIWPALLIFFTTLQSIAWYMASFYWWASGLDVLTGLDIYVNGGGEGSQSENPAVVKAWSYIAGICSLCLICTAMCMLFNETREMVKEGVRLYISSGWNQLDLSVILLSLASGAATFIRPTLAQPMTQFACMICWLEIFNMLRADAMFGLIVRMYLNIASDIRQLMNLQALLIVGTSFSFIGVFTKHRYNDDIPIEDRQQPEALRDIWNTVLHVYSMLLGNISLDDFSGLDYPVFYEIMFLVFVYLQTILMMNLIIAMMGESFEKVLQTAQRELTMDRAETLVRVELTMGVAKMRNMGYIPRYLQVLLPREELTSEYTGTESPTGEWEGVAGTVTAKLGKRLDERAAKTDAMIVSESQRRAQHLSEQIIVTKKDLADRMGNLEHRLAAFLAINDNKGSRRRSSHDAAHASSTSAASPSDIPTSAAALFLPGSHEEVALRRIIKEELASLINS